MDRHLLPEEIDLLLDGEVGFGTAPLKAHVRRCEQCRAEFDDARALVRELEHLPYLAPSPLFAQQVMGRVQVFVPWYAALINWARGWVPKSRPALAAAGVSFAIVAAALTIGMIWVASRFDAVVFALGMGVTRAREIVLASIGQVASELFGEPVMAALRESGTLGLTLAMLTLLLMTAVAAGALRLLAAGANRR